VGARGRLALAGRARRIRAQVTPPTDKRGAEVHPLRFHGQAGVAGYFPLGPLALAGSLECAALEEAGKGQYGFVDFGVEPMCWDWRAVVAQLAEKMFNEVFATPGACVLSVSIEATGACGGWWAKGAATYELVLTTNTARWSLHASWAGVASIKETGNLAGTPLQAGPSAATQGMGWRKYHSEGLVGNFLVGGWGDPEFRLYIREREQVYDEHSVKMWLGPSGPPQEYTALAGTPAACAAMADASSSVTQALAAPSGSWSTAAPTAPTGAAASRLTAAPSGSDNRHRSGSRRGGRRLWRTQEEDDEEALARELATGQPHPRPPDAGAGVWSSEEWRQWYDGHYGQGYYRRHWMGSSCDERR